MTAVYETLSAGIAAAGVDTVFGVMGSGTDELTRELVEVHALRYVAARHEHGAIAMADGYARATGRIGMAFVSADAGVTNGMTALTTAQLARSSILVVAGDQAARSKADQTRVDQIPLLAALGTRTVMLSQTTAQRDLEFALRMVDLGRGPVVLNVPWDTSNATDPGSGSRHALRLSPRTHRVPTVDASTLDELLGLIALSRRPLVLAGRGAVAAGGDVLRRLAERIGAATATTLLARSFFDADPCCVGVCGSFSTTAAEAVIMQADLVLAFGCSLNSHTRGHGALFPQARVVQVDTDPEALGRWGPIHLGVVGDVRAVAEDLFGAAEALDHDEAIGEDRWRGPRLAERVRAFDKWDGVDLEGERPGYANPYQVIKACDELLPANRLVAIDIGYFLSYPAVFLDSGTTPSMICPWEYGAIGCALGPAIGAAIGRPDLYPVLVAGDGGMAATLNELDTVVRCGLGMLVLVFDDSGYRAERELFRRRDQSAATADIESPDFAAVAAAMGFDAFTVESGAEMRVALGKLRLEVPTLIRVRMDPDRPNPEMAKAMQGL